MRPKRWYFCKEQRVLSKVTTKSADKQSKKKKRGSRPTTSRWFLGSLFNLGRRFGSQILWVGLLVYLVKIAGNVMIAYAGRNSNANLAIRIAANLNVAFAFSVTTSIVTSGLYIGEFKRHRQTRKRLTARVAGLELQIDPNRTSSRLTSEGMTQREDL